MNNEERTKNIDINSIGYMAIKELEKGLPKKIKKKKNGAPLNIKIRKKDLVMFESIAAQYGVPRNWLMSELIETDIKSMFDYFKDRMKFEIAQAADDYMTSKEMEHDFRGATWYWDVVQPDPFLFHPDSQGIETLMKGGEK